MADIGSIFDGHAGLSGVNYLQIEHVISLVCQMVLGLSKRGGVSIFALGKVVVDVLM